MFKLNKLTPLSKVVLIIILLLVYSLILEASYAFFETEIYGYDGYKLDISIKKYIFSKLLLAIYLTTSIYVYNRSKFIYFVYILLGVFSFLPNLILYSMMNINIGPSLSLFFALQLIAFISTIQFKVRPLNSGIKINNLFIIGITLILVLPFILKYNFQVNFKTLLFKDIYTTRALFSERLGYISSYFLFWLTRVSAPVLLIYGLIRKKRIFILISIVILLYIYMISGHKAVFMASFVLIFFYYTGKDYYSKLFYFLFALLCFIILIPIIDLLINRNLFHAIFITRVFFMPALLNFCYFDFFDSNYIFLSHSIFSSFIEYPFVLEPANLIGFEYFGRPEMHANNGVISDGFKNFGYIGVFIFSFLYSVFFAIINSLKLDIRYAGIFFLVIRLFIGAEFLTSFLTHGLWLLIIFAFVLMKENK
jgi:O-antigen polymerase